jgi:serine protease Do
MKFLLATLGLAFVSPSMIDCIEETRPSAHEQNFTDFRQVAKKAIPAVVSISVQKRTPKPYGRKGSPYSGNYFDSNDLWDLFGLPRPGIDDAMEGQASGVLVSPDGYILTNSHVVHDMQKIVVQLDDGREFPAKVLGEDTNSDLALIKIEGSGFPSLTLGNSDDLEVGQWVAAIGIPFGLQATLTAGVVSAKSRNNLDMMRNEDFIQTDAAINRGNSGGPLLNLNGEVIGINTAIATNASSSYLGIGFAIPSNMAKHAMEQIISNGKVQHGFLGIALQSLDYNLAQSFGLEKVEGALVTHVVEGSAADQADLRVEDIILKINGRPVKNAAALRNAVYVMKPGTEAILTVLRQNKLIDVPIKVGSEKEETVASNATPNLRLGIQVDTLTPELAKTLGLMQEKGVVITKIDPQSAARLAGLKTGALIMGVNRKKVETIEQFEAALKEIPAGRPVLLQIKQGDRYVFVSLQEE